MRNPIFKFKQFDCTHQFSSMKIGVDAVLLGAWCDVSDASGILDVGTGCGVISLMCAQRNKTASITAIDIDADSVAESERNFMSSPWPDRLHSLNADFNSISSGNWDLIVSNPPFFDSGIIDPSTPRMVARHIDALSPEILVRRAPELISAIGRVALILPFSSFERLVAEASLAHLTLRRALYVRGNGEAPVKRVLAEFSRIDNCLIKRDMNLSEIETLTLETSPGHPTEAYLRLCKDFYLKF